MKKLVVLAAALAAASALGILAGSAAAQGGSNLTLSATPNPVAPGSDFTPSGRLTDSEGSPMSDSSIQIGIFSTPDCTGRPDSVTRLSTDEAGDFSTLLTTVDLEPGHYYLEARYSGGEEGVTTSPCIDVLVGANANAGSGGGNDATQPARVVPQANSVYLCYSTFQSVPGVWSSEDGASLLAQGYWEPTAVDGNVDGGINVGSYHLQCNVTPKGDGFVGDGGAWYGTEYAATAAQQLGFYAH